MSVTGSCTDDEPIFTISNEQFLRQGGSSPIGSKYLYYQADFSLFKKGTQQSVINLTTLSYIYQGLVVP